MSKEELTPEEAEMLEVMARDDAMDEPKALAEPKAEEPAEEATEDQPAEDPKEPEFKSSRTEEKPPEGYVPHQALHAERLKRQELDRQLSELMEWKKAQEAAQQEQPPQYVDPLEDPEGHRKYVDYHNNQTAEQVKQVQEQIQRQQQQAQIQQSVAQAEQQFMQQQGDYKDAIKFLQDTRMKELTSQGFDPQSAMRQMSQDAMGIYQAAQMMGVNPAQMAYMRAQSLGYSNQPKQDDAQKMEALNKAQEQTSGITGSGAPQKGKLTLAALSEMSEAEIAEIPEAEIRKVMEG